MCAYFHVVSTFCIQLKYIIINGHQIDQNHDSRPPLHHRIQIACFEPCIVVYISQHFQQYNVVCVSGLVVKCPLAMRTPRVRFPADAYHFFALFPIFFIFVND